MKKLYLALSVSAAMHLLSATPGMTMDAQKAAEMLQADPSILLKNKSLSTDIREQLETYVKEHPQSGQKSAGPKLEKLETSELSRLLTKVKAAADEEGGKEAAEADKAAEGVKKLLHKFREDQLPLTEKEVAKIKEQRTLEMQKRLNDEIKDIRKLNEALYKDFKSGLKELYQIEENLSVAGIPLSREDTTKLYDLRNREMFMLEKKLKTEALNATENQRLLTLRFMIMKAFQIKISREEVNEHEDLKLYKIVTKELLRIKNLVDRKANLSPQDIKSGEVARDLLSNYIFKELHEDKLQLNDKQLNKLYALVKSLRVTAENEAKNKNLDKKRKNELEATLLVFYKTEAIILHKVFGAKEPSEAGRKQLEFLEKTIEKLEPQRQGEQEEGDDKEKKGE